jgi:uncharacterized protein YdeI (BOF family)
MLRWRRNPTKEEVMKALRVAIATAVLAIMLAGCGGTSQAEAECPNGVLIAEGKCSTVQAAREQKHDAQVQGEASEAEAVLKRRNAEELANAAEGH